MLFAKFHKSNLITYLGLASGVVAIFYAFSKMAFSNGEYVRFSLACLVISGVCDMLDGKFARMFKRTSEEKEMLQILMKRNDYSNASKYIRSCIMPFYEGEPIEIAEFVGDNETHLEESCETSLFYTLNFYRPFIYLINHWMAKGYTPVKIECKIKK